MNYNEHLDPVIDDANAWELYKNTSYRWCFNKLEVALRQGLHAGPGASAPEFEGKYISRPIYNLYGMGIEAKQFHYKTSMRRELKNYAIVPPGSFWCEWLEGEQLSIDYKRVADGSDWEASSVWLGKHADENNLTKFEQWTRLDVTLAPKLKDLPLAFDWLDDKRVSGFNVEVRSGYVTEVHLRLGNGHLDGLPVGSIVLPVWDNESHNGLEFWPEDDPEMEEFKAFGRISNIRKGFRVKK